MTTSLSRIHNVHDHSVLYNNIVLIGICESVHDHSVLYNNIVRLGMCESGHDHRVLYNNIVLPVIFM